MAVALEMARYTIKRFWPEALTVNAVYDQFGRDLGLNPHTLKGAKEESLSSIQADKLLALRSLCSIWAGEAVSLDDIVLKDE